MKKRTLVFLPFVGLLLTGCDMRGIADKIKEIGHKIVDPIANILPYGKDESKPDDQHKDDDDDHKDDDDDGGDTTTHTFTLDCTAITLKEGENHTIVAKYDGSTVTEGVTYVSDHPEIASVQAGVVTAVAKGTASVTVSYLDKQAAITVTVTKDETHIDTEHAGTYDDPYSGSDAVKVANSLEAGGSTTEYYYVKGVVQSFEETFSASFGNYSFKIEDGFICWRLKNGASFTNFNEGDIAIGDEVLIYVQIQSYVKEGEDPKPESKNGYVVSVKKPGQATATEILSILSAPTEVEQGATIDPSLVSLSVKFSDEQTKTVAAQQVICDTSATGQVTATAKYEGLEKTFEVTVIASVNPVHAGTEADPFTGADAVLVSSKLALGGVTTESYFIKGIVQSFEETFNASFGNYSFKIEDEFICWRLKNGPEFTKFNDGDIVVGDEVVVYAQIQKYSNGKPETSGGYVVSVSKPAPKTITAVTSVVSQGLPTTVEQNSTIKASDISLNVSYDDGSTGTVKATRVECDTSVIKTGVTATAYYEVEGQVIGSATFTIEVVAKVAHSSISYTFINDKTQAQNVGAWTSEQFMGCVVSDGGAIITGMSSPTNAYIGGNGGSGDAQWNIWNCLKVGKSSAKGSISLTLDPTATFSKIKMDVIGARDDGTLTVNGITKGVTKKAVFGDLEPISIEFEIAENTGSLLLESKDASSNNYGICITKIEFVDGSVSEPVAKLSSLELTTAPTKSSYYVGESFDANGMVITAKYTNGGADKVLQSSDYSIDKTTLALGDEYVVVSYTEDDVTKTVQVPITVTKAPVPVTGITLNQSTLSMHVLDADVQLVATVAPADADDKTVTWTVSEQGIVTVSNGLVHALAAGEVTVTAAAGDFSATCVVTVAAAEKVISGIAVATQPSKTTYVEGESFNPSGMTITVSYSSPHEPETISSGFTYSTDPLTTSTNSIVITYCGFTANVSVTVTPAPVLDSISVANAEGKTNAYTVGAVISKDDLVVTAHYTQGKQDAVVTDYTISKTTALAVTDTSVTISYTEGGIEKTATYSFTVTKPTEPQIDVSNVDLYSIDAASLGLDSYADGTNTDLAWTMLCKGSSDTVQGNSSKSSELHNKIAFSKNITYIKFNVGYAAGDASTGSVRFGSSVTPTGNDTSYGANTDLSLVTVGSFNVCAPAGCNYFSVVWTKGASYFSSIEIHFNEMGSAEQVAVQSVSLNKTSTSINVGSNETLVATVTPSNANDKSVTWSSSNSSVATVDSTGKVTGIAQGTATITVKTTDGEKTATCSVTVVPAGSITSSPIDLGGSATVVFNGTSYSNSIKAGTGSAAGSTTISVPSGANILTFYAAGWNKESVTISVSGGGISKSFSLTSDEGVSGNGPTYTLGSTDDASFKFEIDVSSLSGATTLTLSATSGKRFVVWNASYTK